MPMHAVALAARGLGSLVGSVVTADTDFARHIVLGLAPWHGRLLVLDRDDAAESTGHGSPLPMLVHGGPGRAGGGEELGGMRAVLHHMQRTAVQASPQVLGAVTGRWTAPAARRMDGVHPFRKSLAELQVGDALVAGPRSVTLADIEHFAEFTGDTFYAHMDDEAARANPFFDGRVAHGYLIVSFAAGLFVDPDPGPVLANYGLENLRFLTPVYPGDELTVTLTCAQITPRPDAEHGEVRWDVEVTNQDAAVGGPVRRAHDGGQAMAVTDADRGLPAAMSRRISSTRSAPTGASSRATGCRSRTGPPWCARSPSTPTRRSSACSPKAPG